MAATVPQGALLDVLKKKMRQTKEEMEKYKEDCEELQKKLHLETMRREEVRIQIISSIFQFLGEVEDDPW